jgi:eukaryotic-like serine/threonine-protein kinase
VFSLGAMLALAAGQGPFGGGSTVALICRVVHSPPNLDDIPEQVRPWLSAACPRIQRKDLALTSC